jgi:hypothetical protein
VMDHRTAHLVRITCCSKPRLALRFQRTVRVFSARTMMTGVQLSGLGGIRVLAQITDQHNRRADGVEAVHEPDRSHGQRDDI